MKKWMSILLLTLVFLLNNSCEKGEIVIDVETEILKEMQAQHIPSVVACVVKGGEIVWEGTFGYANVAESKPPTDQTLYTLMSISKLVLSTAVMQLWENGMIDLEADINQYLPFEVRNPRFPDDKITSYMLLNHTSSLARPEVYENFPEFEIFFPFGDEPLISEWIPEYILPGGEHYKTIVWKEYRPGEKWLYSNIGTSLLGLIVENIAGEDYRDYCRNNILEPLDMHNTAFRLEYMNEDLLATPYDNNNNPMYPYTSRHYPAGFLNTNLEDFSHFVIAMLNYGEYNGTRILERSSVEKMIELQSPASGISFLWWHCIGDCIAHEGGGTGFSTSAEWHFQDGSGMFIFSNKVNDAVYPGGRINELVRYKGQEY